MDARAYRWGARTCAIAAAALGALGASGLAGWLSGRLVLASLGAAFIPMAPLTALAFVSLAIAFLRLRRRTSSDIPATIAAALVCALGSARFIALLSGGTAFPDVEATLVRSPGAFGAVPLARISPVTAACLAATGAAIILLATRRRRWSGDIAGWLGTAVVLTGCTVLLGYAYGTPLLYGGSVIPVALPTGGGLVLSGIATLAVAGPLARPMRAFTQGDARARLLRAFLPATTGAVLVASATGDILTFRLHVNPALAAAVAAVAAVGVVATLVWRIAGTVGHAIDRAEETLTRARDDLEAAVAARTAELARINEELNAFASSVSHDLRAPLRHMTGFATLLERKCRDGLGDEGRNYARQVIDAGGRMSRLIDDLLAFARTAQTPIRTVLVDLTDLVRDVIDDASTGVEGRAIEWHVDPLPSVEGDRALLRQALTNLITNAVKYTRTRDQARIHIGMLPSGDGERVLYVRDNGVGFDMAYVDKLFGVFQRLHAAEQFEGTGIGLANVRRIIQRHGGRTWAEGVIDQGATFFVSLPSHERTTIA
ncbi:MAG TPA: ATP-binding protein [Gemmatimonadaceae bacterium]|nr:ATP-binding protein [Gemmatimonadaceae bacterium]